MKMRRKNLHLKSRLPPMRTKRRILMMLSSKSCMVLGTRRRLAERNSRLLKTQKILRMRHLLVERRAAKKVHPLKRREQLRRSNQATQNQKKKKNSLKNLLQSLNQ
jgi:hypothetical protein